MSKPLHACVESIMPDHWHSQNCGVSASIEREGKWYCKRHDPVKRAAERARKDALWKAKNTETRALWQIGDLEQKLLRLVCPEGTVLHDVRVEVMELIEKIRAGRRAMAGLTRARKALEKKP